MFASSQQRIRASASACVRPFPAVTSANERSGANDHEVQIDRIDEKKCPADAAMVALIAAGSNPRAGCRSARNDVKAPSQRPRDPDRISEESPAENRRRSSRTNC